MPDKKPWTVIGATAAAVAIGTAGLMMGGGEDDVALGRPITLRDGVPVTGTEVDEETAERFKVFPALSLEDGNGSPGLAPQPSLNDSPDNSPQQAPAPAAFDSPDNSPQLAPAPAAFDSPDLASVDSPDASA